ncbi:hypothetical protein COV15_02550 [Candidatus Woesearchaeota archaeon CG10_big_fil_rev_8_21_14_0_10_34_12]|nr:MAG: hypothetical protein COV15_02550 [Candidatus Woesearchaeota archaeon CG10_big_fil_rev_8_21_14_0_10_34_12]
MRKGQVIEINRYFDSGIVVNPDSLEYALEIGENWFDELIFLTRAILVDHSFEEGNKRTGATIICLYFNIQKIKFSKNEVLRIIIEIILDNITDKNELRNKLLETTKGKINFMGKIPELEIRNNIKPIIKKYKDLFDALLEYEQTKKFRFLKE